MSNDTVQTPEADKSPEMVFVAYLTANRLPYMQDFVEKKLARMQNDLDYELESMDDLYRYNGRIRGIKRTVRLVEQGKTLAEIREMFQNEVNLTATQGVSSSQTTTNLYRNMNMAGLVEVIEFITSELCSAA